jgi:eukaryotic-like serine/threonine-protein kinase
MPSIGPWQFFPDYFEPTGEDFIYDSPLHYPKMVHLWRARNRNNQKTVVFKAIHKDLSYDPTKEQEENQVLKELNGQPNLLEVYDIRYDPPADWIFYQLEYCEGNTLHDHLYHPQRQRSLSEKRCLEIAEGILTGLSYMHNHKKKLIHRDLKPGNIFFCKDGTPKIGDYGLVRSTKWERFVSTAGTPGYKAPEKKYDHRSDIYSVGIILKEMLAAPEAKSTSSNKEVEKIIIIATNQNPNKRYQSAKEFLEEIQEIKS